MPLKTTVIGAWPKPEYLKLGDWFENGPSEIFFTLIIYLKTYHLVYLRRLEDSKNIKFEEYPNDLLLYVINK